MGEKYEQLFAYGTLMPGHCNYVHAKPYVVKSLDATVSGLLIDRGRSPGLIDGEGIVRGKLLLIKSEALSITDEIENYKPDSSRSDYLRKRIDARLTDGSVILAWTYYLADPERAAHRAACRIDRGAGAPVYEWRGR